MLTHYQLYTDLMMNLIFLVWGLTDLHISDKQTKYFEVRARNFVKGTHFSFRKKSFPKHFQMQYLVFGDQLMVDWFRSLLETILSAKDAKLPPFFLPSADLLKPRQLSPTVGHFEN